MIDLFAEVKCPHCNEQNRINCSGYVVDESFYEKDMGCEHEYTIDIEECVCSNCNGVFGIKGVIGEYPEGCEERNDFLVK